MYIPVNVGNSHWILVLVDVKTHKVHTIDPFFDPRAYYEHRRKVAQVNTNNTLFSVKRILSVAYVFHLNVCSGYCYLLQSPLQ